MVTLLLAVGGQHKRDRLTTPILMESHVMWLSIAFHRDFCNFLTLSLLITWDKADHMG